MEERLSLVLREPKKTRKGWLGNKVRQVHLRDDVSSGLEKYLESNLDTSMVEETPTTIFFVDTSTLIEQTDIIYNCQELRDVVFLQSSI